MSGLTLESKNLKLEILPEGQELIREIMDLACQEKNADREFNNSDLAVIVSDALMYYKILLENKSKGGEVVLNCNNQSVKLPIIASIN